MPSKLRYATGLCLLPMALSFVAPRRARVSVSMSDKNPFQSLAERVQSVLPGQDNKDASSAFPELQGDVVDPGLKVGANAWKWPPRWPYQDDSFSVKKADVEAQTLLDALPALADTGRDRLAGHYTRFVQPGQKVLALFDADEGWSPSSVDITTSSVTPQGLSAGEALPFEADSFDHVVVPAGAVKYVSEPRAVFREIWRVVKPGGEVMVSFSKEKGDETKGDSAEAVVKMWGGMNDAQRIWIVGSFFQFSTGTGVGGGDAGWEELKGYELSSETLSKGEADAETAEAAADDAAVYVVQARKQTPPSAEEDAYKSLMYRFALDAASSMTEPDRQLVSLRLARELQRAPESMRSGAAAERALDGWRTSTGEIYDVLKPMGDVLGPDLRALLAALLVPRVAAASEEGKAKLLEQLKQGLGLETPVGDLWEPVGAATKSMPPEDRIFLLGAVIPFFSTDAAAEKLDGFAGALAEASAIVMDKLYPKDADMYYEIENPDEPTKGDCQTLASDLCLSDFLGAPLTATEDIMAAALSEEERAKFVPWLQSVDKEDLRAWAIERRNFKAEALRVHEEKLKLEKGESLDALPEVAVEDKAPSA